MVDLEVPMIKADIEFDDKEDKKEFSEEPRLVTLVALTYANGETKLSMGFRLNRKDDDGIELIFNAEELIQKITKAIINADDLRQ